MFKLYFVPLLPQKCLRPFLKLQEFLLSHVRVFVLLKYNKETTTTTTIAAAVAVQGTTKN